MSVFGLLKQNGAIIGGLGFISALVSAIIIWVTMASGDTDAAIASQVGQRMIFMAVVMPLILVGLMHLGREQIGSAPRNTMMTAFALIGAGGGLFSAMVYFFVGFQVPSLFAGVDTFVLFDTLVPFLFSTGLITTITTGIGGAIGAYMISPAE